MEEQPVVVVIDDSPTIRKIMELTLKRSGIKVVGAASGAERSSVADMVASR